MRGPVVCLSALGNLWLILRTRPRTVCLNLETGEVRNFTRSLNELMNWGWRVIEGGEHLELRPL